jgi:SAM-dependent methyltransferase
LTRNTVFMEIGPGDCALAFAVASRVKIVYAVDITDGFVSDVPPPANFHFVNTNGVAVPVAPNTVHLAYSNQVLEHLHPDDALEHLSGVYTALVPGGRFICVTPNRLSGPWDVSRHFDDVARGFHLKEYTTSEVADVLRAVGFTVRLIATYKGRRVLPYVPEWPIRAFEVGLERLPRPLRHRIASCLTALKVIATRPP